MQRVGKINDPSFRIVVTEHARAPQAGKFVEKLGTYNPKTKVRTLDEGRVKHWLSVGAQASGTMHNMLVSAGIISGKKVNVLPKKTVPKKEEEVVAAAPGAAETVAVDAPAPEVKEEVVPEAPTETPVAEVASADAGGGDAGGSSA